MERAHSINQQPEAVILQHSQCGLIHKIFDITTLQKLAGGRKRSVFRLDPTIPDHLNTCPPYFHEYWRPHPWILGLWGSHLGRVYLAHVKEKIPVGRYLLSSELPPGGLVPVHLEKRYMHAELSPRSRFVYRIIAECWFFIKKGWHVHHINNNSLDCAIENLIPLSSLFHMAIHKPYKYKHKFHLSPFSPKTSEKNKSIKPKNLFTGIFDPRWKGFILVHPGTVSNEVQFIFRDIGKFSDWFLQTYSPLITRGPRKGEELTVKDVKMIALSLTPQSNFFLGFNFRISFWIPPLSLRIKWKYHLPEENAIDPQWILPPTFKNLQKMKKS